MLRPALLLLLSQSLVVWTDAEGVMHAGPAETAPSHARPIDGPFSAIERDGRPRVLPDGGLREVDTRWWEARLRTARQTLETKRARLVVLETEVSHQKSEVCAVAEAEAVARSPVLVATPEGVRPLLVNGQPVLGPEKLKQTVTRTCVAGRVSPALAEELAVLRREIEAAQAAVKTVQAEALAAGAPL